MTKDIEELKESLEFTQTQMEEKEKSFKKIEEKTRNMELLNTFIKKDVEAMETNKEELIDFENHSRRNNFRFDGINC